MDCALHEVLTDGYELAAPLSVGDPTSVAGGERQLPRGSLVRGTGEACADGAVVRVVSLDPWYAVPDSASVGDVGCLRTEALGPLRDRRFVAQADGSSFAAGDLLGPLPDGLACDASSLTPAGHDPITTADLAALTPIDAASLQRVTRVRDAYTALFGPIGLQSVPWTHWGRVGLPMTHELTPAEIDAEAAREGLDTPRRREKVVVAVGPDDAWVHFAGTDAPHSDIWGTPDTIVRLLTLAHAWQRHCVGEPGRCTLQIGDIAWYSDQRPDPLGHKDHWQGTCVDLRLFRTDGSRYEALWSTPDDRTGATAYDRARTIDFLTFAARNAPLDDVFFNDPEVIAAVPGVRSHPGHDDHVHLCFADP